MTDHAEERSLQREISDVELHSMLEEVSSITRSQRPARWVLRTRQGLRPWKLVVEPVDEDQIVEVITAYRI